MGDAPTIKGEKQEIKAGLFSITCPADNGKLLAFWNSTKDLQFNIALDFQDPDVIALGDTKNEGTKYAVTLYPGETKECVSGKWKAMRRSLSFGAPDKEWQEKQASSINEAMEGEILTVKKVLKENPKADGKYTAEYIAQVCEATGTPFVDLTYPPREASLARDFEPKLPTYAWMRPSTYCKEDQQPCLYVGDIEPNDIDQGQLGDCYFMCALACVSEFPDLIRGAFAPPQNPALGVYRCLMCKNGWWQVVTIDDTLPINPATSLPVFAKNREEPNELWVSLLEKAYAKLHGSFAAIKSGDPALAMADMVGGPYEKFKNRPEWEDKEKMFDYLAVCDENDYLMSLGTPGSDTSAYATGGAPTAADVQETADRYKAVGLCSGHAFSLIRVKRTKQGHKLCMIRNPWGNDMEWNGDWSDDSNLWTDDIKKEVGFYSGNDGTFWMSWDDVLKWFDAGSITYPLKNWSQVRIPANFEKGIPDLVMQVHVSEPVKCWLGAHQRDNRGLPTGDKDKKYVGMLLSVLQQKDGEDAVEKVGTSGSGSFQLARDVFAEVELQPSTKTTPYFILVQSYGDDDKSFTASLFCQDNSKVKVSFVSYKEDAKKKYNPVSQFKPSTCSQRVAANYQVVTPGHPMPQDGQGEALNWAPQPAAPAAAAGKGKAASKTPVKAPASAPAKAAVKTPAPAATGPARRKLQITVIQGRNLVAKDIGGKSDPFVTLILKDAKGQKYPKVEEKSTKYINNTLNPTWGEAFTFDVLPDDIILAECWDKDTFGKDAMGSTHIGIKDLELTPGGPAKMDFFTLEGGDATGDIQILFSYV